jgi:threonine dehydrogenase-like Zn-dependent dehydrogenase
MRALVFDSALAYQVRHPEPVEAAGDTLIRVKQAGICATDLEITKGYMGFRGVLGHEFVGGGRRVAAEAVGRAAGGGGDQCGVRAVRSVRGGTLDALSESQRAGDLES